MVQSEGIEKRRKGKRNKFRSNIISSSSTTELLHLDLPDAKLRQEQIAEFG